MVYNENGELLNEGFFQKYLGWREEMKEKYRPGYAEMKKRERECKETPKISQDDQKLWIEMTEDERRKILNYINPICESLFNILKKEIPISDLDDIFINDAFSGKLSLKDIPEKISYKANWGLNKLKYNSFKEFYKNENP